MPNHRATWSVKSRWALVVGVALFQPIVVFLGHPYFGTAINTLSFIPPVIAALFFGFRVGLGFAVVSTLFTFLVFLHVTAVPAIHGIPPVSVSFAATTVICFGASRIRSYLNDRRTAETALKNRERQYRMIFEHSADGILCLDAQGVILDANPQVATHLGPPAETLLGCNIDSVAELGGKVGTSIAQLLSEDASYNTARNMEIVSTSRDGAPRYIECSVSSTQDAESLTRWIVLLRNVTGRRHLEVELHQAKKMGAIGRLAGGVAHDMNNTLNAIMGSAFALRHELTPYQKSFEDLENISSACDRGAQLTQNLLGFARKSSYVKQVFSLNNVLETILALLKRVVLKNIQIDLHLADGLPLTEGDLGRIENAVMNLCLNALDAMKNGGRLTLETRSDGGYVTVRVSDTGTGMDDVVKEQIFEPFFTTKPVGEGTGLGLSLVYGVIQAHDGKIEIESAPGKGTTVLLAFHGVTDGLQASRSLPVPTAPVNGRFLCGKTILVIDDEPLVLRATSRMLRTLACNVLAADGGRKGIEIFKANQNRISLVILDLHMPDMDGSVTLVKLNNINPSIPVLLASGYTDEADKIEALQAEKSNLAFIAKPYRAESLITTLKQLLEFET